jgi:hypothetical protein
MTSSTPTPPPPPAAGSGELIYPPQPPKDPAIILILNLLLFGCVGYFMMGQKMKGIVAVIAWVVLAIPTCGVLSGIISVVAAIDGYLQAQHHQAGYPLGPWTFFKDHR